MTYQKLPSDEADIESPYLTSSSENRWSAAAVLNLAIKALLCTLLLLCSIVVFVGLTTDRLSWGRCSSRSDFQIPHIYGTKTQYMSLSPEYDQLWTTELSDHNSMITLATHSDGSEEHGAISMFHQLHCLSSIRMALQKASNGEDIGTDWKDDLHWPHCLHHLRQMILCFADGSVERGIIINGTRTNAIDGAMDVRMCRDPTKLYDRRRREGLKEFKGAAYTLDW